MSDQFSFEKLNVYQQSRQLVRKVYGLISAIPSSEKFGLCNQLQRAIISVPSNIAEGSGRRSMKEKVHFIEIAFGSLFEAYCQIEIAEDLGYIEPGSKDKIKTDFIKIAQSLSSLSNSYSQQP